MAVGVLAGTCCGLRVDRAQAYDELWTPPAVVVHTIVRSDRPARLTVVANDPQGSRTRVCRRRAGDRRFCASARWYTIPGKYDFELHIDRDEGETVRRATVEVDGGTTQIGMMLDLIDDDSLTVHGGGVRTPRPAGLRLEPMEREVVEGRLQPPHRYRLVNGTDQPVHGTMKGGRWLGSLLRWRGDRWQGSPVWCGTNRHAAVLPPGQSAIVPDSLRLPGSSSRPGLYRFVVGLWQEDQSGERRSVSLEYRFRVAAASR